MYIVVEPFLDRKDGKEYKVGDVYTGSTSPERIRQLMTKKNPYKEVFIKEKTDEDGNINVTEE